MMRPRTLNLEGHGFKSIQKTSLIGKARAIACMAVCVCVCVGGGGFPLTPPPPPFFKDLSVHLEFCQHTEWPEKMSRYADKKCPMHQGPVYILWREVLKTLLNIVETPFKKCWTLMSVLYMMMFRWTNKQPGIQKFWNLCGHYQDIYHWVSPLNKRSGSPFILTQQSK